MSSPQNLPVTLLTGFLGAGKTTLLNRVLSETSEKVAVIVNEFGEAGLDHDLIESVENEVVLMQSGCLCCSIRGDLSNTISQLLAKRDDGLIQFDRVVIETTGLANPGPILQTFTLDAVLRRDTRLDGVVTVFDAVNGPTTLDRQFEAVSQVAMADLLLLSKTDLLSRDAADAVEVRLRTLNPTAPLLQCAKGDIDPAAMWQLTGMRETASPEEVIGWTTPETTSDVLGNLSGFAPAPVTQPVVAPHDSTISSISVVFDEPLDDAVFDTWFDSLIATKAKDLLRVKGILFLKDIETPFAFHGVQHVFDAPVPITSWTGDDRRTRIVLIGRNLDGLEIQRSLDALKRAHAGQSAGAAQATT